MKFFRFLVIGLPLVVSSICLAAADDVDGESQASDTQIRLQRSAELTLHAMACELDWLDFQQAFLKAEAKAESLSQAQMEKLAADFTQVQSELQAKTANMQCDSSMKQTIQRILTAETEKLQAKI